ncbi:MAG TPA: dienelactone hydrolase family protein [Acidobacteriota bacterium]|nr:dienelactone hydrolase family protein [Acidobacteriota bacterium]
MIQGSLKSSFTLDYVLHTPAAEPPWPVFIVLHGFGQTALDFSRSFLPLVEKGIMVAAPQAPHPTYLNRERELGFSWLTRYQRDRAVEELADYLTSFYRLLKGRNDIDPEQVGLFGFSQGSSIAYRLWIRRAFPVSRLFSCGGDLPPDVEDRLEEADPLPVFVMHGAHDHLVPASKPIHAHHRLKAHGIPATRLEYSCGHEVAPEMVRDVARQFRALN